MHTMTKYVSLRGRTSWEMLQFHQGAMPVTLLRYFCVFFCKNFFYFVLGRFCNLINCQVLHIFSFVTNLHATNAKIQMFFLMVIYK